MPTSRAAAENLSTGQRRVTYEYSSEGSNSSEAVTVATSRPDEFYQNIDALQADELRGSLDKIKRTYVRNTKFTLDREFVQYCQTYVRDTASLTSTMTGKFVHSCVLLMPLVHQNCHLHNMREICHVCDVIQ